MDMKSINKYVFKLYKEEDIKKFIQKVKEDVKRAYKVGVDECKAEQQLDPLDDKEVNTIIDKRAGNL